MQPSGGLRASKKQATRLELSRATRRLALDKGWDAVTIEQVSAAVGVSVRTFHNYFTSKEEAALGDGPPLTSPAQRATFVAGGPSGDLLTDALVLVDANVDEQLHADVMSTYALVQREPRLADLWVGRVQHFEQDIAALAAERLGTGHDDDRCALLAATTMAAVRVAWGRWGRQPSIPFSTHLHQLQDGLRVLLAPAPSREGASSTATSS